MTTVRPPGLDETALGVFWWWDAPSGTAVVALTLRHLIVTPPVGQNGLERLDASRCEGRLDDCSLPPGSTRLPLSQITGIVHDVGSGCCRLELHDGTVLDISPPSDQRSVAAGIFEELATRSSGHPDVSARRLRPEATA